MSKKHIVSLVFAALTISATLFSASAFTQVPVEGVISPLNGTILQNTLDEMNHRSNMVGRFIVPECNIDVAAFNSSSQETVDKRDSAAMYPLGDMQVLADHNYQSFFRLRDIEVGDRAYFIDGNEIKEYICTDTFTGYNKLTDLTNKKHESIRYSNPGGITCYTCRWNWKNIRIVFFQPINEPQTETTAIK